MSRWLVAVLLVGCGDDGGARPLPDAPPPPDTMVDTGIDDAPVDMSIDAMVMLEMGPTLAPSLGGLCGLAWDHVDSAIWLYPCSGATITQVSTAGAMVTSVARPGEAANDVDLAVAPAAITLGTTALAAGALVFVNGEVGPMELYTPEATATAVLATQFGMSHVVGSAYHTGRSTVFAVQDRVPGGTEGNRVAEIDPITGAIVNSFSILPAFDVNYGDLDVCQSSGNLFLVSSNETTIAEFTPAGTLVGEYPLPAGVTDAAGIGIVDGGNAAWIATTLGTVIRVDGVPCN
jgi:hypothetical protein